MSELQRSPLDSFGLLPIDPNDLTDKKYPTQQQLTTETLAYLTLALPVLL